MLTRKFVIDKSIISLLLFCMIISITYTKAGSALRNLQYIIHRRDYVDTSRSFPLASIRAGVLHKYVGNIAIKHIFQNN